MGPIRARWRSLLRRQRPNVVDRELVDLAVGLVPADRPARVAVLAPEVPSPLVGALRRRLPQAEVDELEIGHPGPRHVLLTARGPYDLVLDAADGPQGRVIRFQDCFFQLRAGGHHLVGDGAGEASAPTDVEGDGPGRLGALLAKAAARRGEAPPESTKGLRPVVLDELALAEAVASVEVRGPHLVVTSAGASALAKMREIEGNELIAARPDLGHRVLDSLPGERFDSRCTLTESGPTRDGHPPTTFDAPPVFLREYRDVVVAPYQIVAGDGVLWPDTFRHNARRRIRNLSTLEVAPRFARLPFETDDLPVLEGTYFHLDNEVRGHFGHLMTEVVSRLWAWPDAKQREPDLKVLVGTNRRPEVMPYEYEIYEAAGIAREDVVLIDHPVRVPRLLSASPMLSNPEYIHPRLQETWQRIGDHLAAGATGGPRPARFFCSRRIKKRSCHNTDEVEQIFRDAGFEIVFPEDYSLGDQVEMFRSAEVIGGFAGSGLFNICFAERPLHVVTIASDAYDARNEYLFASVLGHRIDSIRSVPDVPNEFQSPFTFDVDREGESLRQVLAALP